MMKNFSFFKSIFAIAIIALLSSCGQFNIQKRQYSSGWTIFSGKGVKSEQPVVRQHRKPVKPAMAAPQTGMAQVIDMPASESFGGLPEYQTVVPETMTSTAEIPAVKMNFIQKMALKKALKNIQPGDKKIKQRSGHPASAEHSNDTELVLLVILAILLPPLAVFLYEDQQITINFWLALLFWLLLILPGIIYALWVILADGGVA